MVSYVSIRGGKMTYRKYRKGAALLLSMIILALLSAWAVSINSMTNTNVQLAENQRKVNHARSSAESGLDVLRFWLDQFAIPSTTTAPAKFSNLVAFLQNDLPNITAYDEGAGLITVPAVILDSTAAESFSAEINADNPANAEILQVDVTGTSGTITRTIRVKYDFGPRVNPLFDYGIATKGPLQMTGNVDLEGASVDASVYIEAEGEETALEMIGKCTIAGDVSIVDPCADAQLSNASSIGGETGQDAIDNHVSFGEAPVEFPVPNPSYFEQYIQNTYDPNNVLTEYENVRIPAGTDPSFSGGVTLEGIVFIETPNVLVFTGHVDITGIIVGDGDANDNSGTNLITFLGTVSSYPVTDLPDESQFIDLKNETGTFLMAPGFSVSFGGNFNTLNGVIAANGIEFFGHAGGTVGGSVINYSNEPMTLTGNTDLFFENSGTVELPAGFDTEIILKYLPEYYCEVTPGL